MPTLTEEEKKEFDKEIEKAEKENDLNDYTIGLFMLSGKTTKQQRTANVIGYIEGLKRGKGIAHSREQRLIKKVVEILEGMRKIGYGFMPLENEAFVKNIRANLKHNEEESGIIGFNQALTQAIIKIKEIK